MSRGQEQKEDSVAVGVAGPVAKTAAAAAAAAVDIVVAVAVAVRRNRLTIYYLPKVWHRDLDGATVAAVPADAMAGAARRQRKSSMPSCSCFNWFTMNNNNNNNNIGIDGLQDCT